MSYHARMTWPWLMVTGRSGAFGNTKRIGRRAGSRSSGTMGSKSWPSAPRPCIQITAAVGLGALSISTASRRSGMAGVVVIGNIRRIEASGPIDTRSAHPYRRGREPRDRATTGGAHRGAARLARWDEGDRDPLDRVLPLLHRVQRRPAAVAARSRLPRVVREDLRSGVSRRAGPMRRVGRAHRGGRARIQRGRRLPRSLRLRALVCARPAWSPADGLGRVVPEPPGSPAADVLGRAPRLPGVAVSGPAGKAALPLRAELPRRSGGADRDDVLLLQPRAVVLRPAPAALPGVPGALRRARAPGRGPVPRGRGGRHHRRS